MKKIAAIALVLAVIPSLGVAAPPTGYESLDSIEAAQVENPQASVYGLYEAHRGDSLRTTLDRWALRAGWQPPVWEMPTDSDFTLGSSARFDGDFVSATSALINATSAASNLRVKFHHANRVLVVELVQ